MIRQNANEPKRKLLESHSLHFVIFLDEHAHIVGFDLEDEDSSHLFQWRRGRRPQFYGVANVGKGCHNRDEVYANGSFDVAGAVAELTARGHNIRDKVREVLIAGLNAYR